MLWKGFTHFKAFSVSHGAPPLSRGCTRSWERAGTGQLTSTEQRDIPHPMMSCSEIKLSGKEENDTLKEFQHVSSQVIITRDGALFSWRWPDSCQPTGNSGLIPYFALLLYAAFALPVKFFLPHKFFTVILPILFLIQLGGEWVSSRVELSCLLGLAHESATAWKGIEKNLSI